LFDEAVLYLFAEAKLNCLSKLNPVQ
jgi:hypothetical protein